MNFKFLPLNSLENWLNELSSLGTLIAPVRYEDGYVAFKVNPPFNRIEQNFLNTAKPFKEFFFPPSETMFEFDITTDGFEVKTKKPEGQMVIFGARLCDAVGLLALDSAFGGEYSDPYYNERRKNSFIIAMFCSLPHPTCFCESVQKLLTEPRGVDILLYPLDDGYVIESLSDKGNELIKKSEHLFTEPDSAQRQKRKDMIDSAVYAQSCKLDFSLLPEKFRKSSPASSFWEEQAEGCVSCGICSFLCPVCQCFSVQDISEGFHGERIRYWASCQDCQFAKMAGGINPRPGKGERLFHRLAHKFSNAPFRNDMIFCTGCGRCIRYCPSHKDLIEILEKFLDYKEVKT
ncbi:MAG: 4Fe-4S dicluster domain-containing protein [Candidatus Eremiobacteraeota bacterium]|nr:4Fe-4S dicluster domain-containing protein [Candidatus Eremiobacteraeota bacterium]